ncbi:GNAT family N-acetyltransferase [Streptomyces capparidis]
MRTLRPEEWDDFSHALVRAFGGIPEPGQEWELWRRLTEFERFTAVHDGDDVVGTSGAFSFRMTVPGGVVVPAAGVTMVSVQASHRRRGVLRAMMRRQLDAVRAAGDEPLAVLTASEPPIYGRFGYGAATQMMSARIDTGQVTLRLPEGADRVRLRIVRPAEARDACEEVYAAVARRRPGMLLRQPGWADRPVLDPPEHRDGAGELQCVTAELDGKMTGYARYAVHPGWTPSGAVEGEVRLRDIEALDPATYAALWRFLFGIDLTRTLVARNRPADDPLLHLVSDVRRCALGMRDELYVRLVDVGAALAARTYSAPVDVVLEVSDAFCPWNEGRWRLTGDAKGASCERTSDAPDLALSVRDLGSAYLGGFSLRAMAGAGLVRELREGALDEASTAFAHDPLPWLPHGF